MFFYSITYQIGITKLSENGLLLLRYPTVMKTSHLVDKSFKNHKFVAKIYKNVKVKLVILPPENSYPIHSPTYFYLIIYFLNYLFIYLWLCWVFVSVRGLSLVAASGGRSSSRCVGLLLSRPLLLQSTGSRRAGSAIVAHGPICSAACGIFPDQGSNPCPLHWQADSQPLRHQGSPNNIFKINL